MIERTAVLEPAMTDIITPDDIRYDLITNRLLTADQPDYFSAGPLVGRIIEIVNHAQSAHRGELERLNLRGLHYDRLAGATSLLTGAGLGALALAETSQGYAVSASQEVASVAFLTFGVFVLKHAKRDH